MDTRNFESHPGEVADASANTNPASKGNFGASGVSYPTPPKKSHGEAVAQLNRAVAVMMVDYNNARKTILYGLDEQCRPLEEINRLSSSPSAAASQTSSRNSQDGDSLRNESGVGNVGGGENEGDRQEADVLNSFSA